jgi:hypothetical protein
MCVLGPADGELSVLLGDRELRMPGWVEPVMRSIVGQVEFTVGDLATRLDAPSRIVLIRRLVVEGLLEVVG